MSFDHSSTGAGGGDEDGYDMTGASGPPTHRDVRNYLRALNPDHLGKTITATLLAYVEQQESVEGTIVCTYCGNKTKRGTFDEDTENMISHMLVCEKAPYKTLLAELSRLTQALNIYCGVEEGGPSGVEQVLALLAEQNYEWNDAEQQWVNTRHPIPVREVVGQFVAEREEQLSRAYDSPLTQAAKGYGSGEKPAWFNPKCDHKFIGSKHCLKCGWAPGPEDLPKPPNKDPETTKQDRVTQLLGEARQRIVHTAAHTQQAIKDRGSRVEYEALAQLRWICEDLTDAIEILADKTVGREELVLALQKNRHMHGFDVTRFVADELTRAREKP